MWVRASIFCAGLPQRYWPYFLWIFHGEITTHCVAILKQTSRSCKKMFSLQCRTQNIFKGAGDAF
jgi:hypothetical protein